MLLDLCGTFSAAKDVDGMQNESERLYAALATKSP
jgi:hypothetical protein